MAPDPGLLITLTQKPEVLQRSVLGCNVPFLAHSHLSPRASFGLMQLFGKHIEPLLYKGFHYCCHTFLLFPLPELMASIVFGSGRFVEALN